MSKKLKQSSLFERLNHFKINIGVYNVLYKVYNREEVSEEVLKKFPESLISNGKLTEKAVKILESIDQLFIIKKNIKLDELMGPEYEKMIEAYIEIFPTAKLPNGKYARGNKKNIETNFKWFFSNYNYSWEIILAATAMYVTEFRSANYMYMRTAMYFIRKDDGTRVVLSDLADYCDKVASGENYVEPKHFKTKVI